MLKIIAAVVVGVVIVLLALGIAADSARREKAWREATGEDDDETTSD